MMAGVFAMAFVIASFGQGSNVVGGSADSHPWNDSSPHDVRLVPVGNDVQLEVIEWGGSGRPLVLLAGLGNTAHVFDEFAPKLTRQFHVYGITRRGFGASSVPASGYSADQLGDDVLAILDRLKIERPILVGHSIAGEELSSIATRFPQRMAGLVYLDVANPYAFYDRKHGAYELDLASLFERLEQMRKQDPLDPEAMRALDADMVTLRRSLQDTLSQVEGDVRNASGPPTKADLASFPAMQAFVARQICARIPEEELRQTFRVTPDGGVGGQRAPSFVYRAILNGEQKYTASHVPMLAIAAMPATRCTVAQGDRSRLRAAQAREVATKSRQYDALQKQVPSAKIVRLANASHYIFLSDESAVLASIMSFAAGLP